jgi:hypothetical protein
MKYDEKEASFYLWGFKSEAPEFSTGELIAPLKIYIFLLPEIISKTYSIKTSTVYDINELEILSNISLGIFLFIISLVLTIFAILCSILTIYYLHKTKEKQMKQGSTGTVIIPIIAILIFFISYVFIFIPSFSTFITSKSSSSVSSINYEFSTGFYLFIIGIVVATIVSLGIFFIRFSNILKSEKNEIVL